MNRSIVLIVALILMSISGCMPPTTAELKDNSTTTVELNSEPAGAALSDGQSFSEIAPFKAEIKWEELQEDGCFYLATVTAIWPSGANETQDVNLCGDSGTAFAYTFNRPESFPDLEIDTEYAKQVEQLRVKKDPSYSEQPWNLYLMAQRRRGW